MHQSIERALQRALHTWERRHDGWSNKGPMAVLRLETGHRQQTNGQNKETEIQGHKKQVK